MPDLPVFGDLTSKYLPLLTSQSYGERALNGERVVDVALKGDSFPAEKAGEGGMRRRPSRADDGAEVGNANGEGSTADVGDL